jgi:hypothetical protein
MMWKLRTCQAVNEYEGDLPVEVDVAFQFDHGVRRSHGGEFHISGQYSRP